MHSEYGINSTTKLNFKRLAKLLKDSMKHKNEREIENLWVALYPLMAINLVPFVKFEDYKNAFECKPDNSTKKDLKSIENEMLHMVQVYERKELK